MTNKLKVELTILDIFLIKSCMTIVDCDVKRGLLPEYTGTEIEHHKKLRAKLDQVLEQSVGDK